MLNLLLSRHSSLPVLSSQDPDQWYQSGYALHWDNILKDYAGSTEVPQPLQQPMLLYKPLASLYSTLSHSTNFEQVPWTAQEVSEALP
jgi:hypothetical protein